MFPEFNLLTLEDEFNSFMIEFFSEIFFPKGSHPNLLDCFVGTDNLEITK